MLISALKKIFLTSFITLLFVFTIACGQESADSLSESAYEKLAGEDADIQVIVDDHYFSAAMELIRSAEATLHLTQLYMNNDPAVRQLIHELGRAAERGIDITVLLNETEERNHWAIEQLYQAGAEVREDSRNDAGKLHAKMIIADRSRLMIGSTNWSGMSIRNTHETNLRIDHPLIADFYARWIEELYSRPWVDPDLETVEVPELKTVIDRRHQNVIGELLDEAEERVWLGIYAFRTYFGTRFEGSTADQMARRLVDANDRGVDVRVIIEWSHYSDFMNEMNTETAKFLRENGVTVKASPEHKTAHWKLLMADEKVLIGSMNWGHSGFDLHAEASILVSNPDVTETFEHYYLNLWNSGELYPIK